MSLKFVDLGRQYRSIQDEVSVAMEEVLTSGAFIMGPQLRSFEAAFAAYCGAEHCVGVGSGTAALELALRAFGIGAGDEVIIPGNTYIATALAVSSVGAAPVLVDAEEQTSNIDVNRIEDAIGPHTKAIIPVHLYGRAADMSRVMEIAKAHDLVVLEDASQAHGAESNGIRVGGIGHAAAFSFYPGKNLGAYGDGGAVTTNDPQLHERLLLLRDFGQSKKYHHELKGTNSRLDTLQAAVLAVKLRHLDTWNGRRRAAAALYNDVFAGSGVIVPPIDRPDQSVHHLYVVRVPNRDEVMSALKLAGIECGIHYPIPIHLQQAYSELRSKSPQLPVTERLSSQILSLPMFPEITESEVERVASVVSGAVRGLEYSA